MNKYELIEKVYSAKKLQDLVKLKPEALKMGRFSKTNQWLDLGLYMCAGHSFDYHHKLFLSFHPAPGAKPFFRGR